MSYKSYFINTKLLTLRLCLNYEGNLIFYCYLKSYKKVIGVAIYSLSSDNFFDITFDNYETSSIQCFK